MDGKLTFSNSFVIKLNLKLNKLNFKSQTFLIMSTYKPQRNMSKEPLSKHDATIRASGFFLSEEFPENFEQMSDEELCEFINDNAFDDFYSLCGKPGQILDAIKALASEYMSIANHYQPTNQL